MWWLGLKIPLGRSQYAPAWKPRIDLLTKKRIPPAINVDDTPLSGPFQHSCPVSSRWCTVLPDNGCTKTSSTGITISALRSPSASILNTSPFPEKVGLPASASRTLPVVSCERSISVMDERGANRQSSEDGGERPASSQCPDARVPHLGFYLLLAVKVCVSINEELLPGRKIP